MIFQAQSTVDDKAMHECDHTITWKREGGTERCVSCQMKEKTRSMQQAFKKMEAALPPLCAEGAAEGGVGCDGFHPRVSLDLTKVVCDELAEFLPKVEQCGGVAAAGVPYHLFLIPKNVTSKRPIVLLPTLTRWWKCSRGPVVKEWQERHRVSWDARARLLALEELNKRLWKRCWSWNSRHQS